MPLERSAASLEFVNSGSSVLLASPDTLLALDLEKIFQPMGLRLETAIDDASALVALQSLEDTALVLLDLRLDWVSSGRLLAALQGPASRNLAGREPGVARRYPTALIADHVSDEWIQRLREGAIDDIVPRSANAGLWTKHLSSMQRGHRLLRELEELRAASSLEAQRDALTGIYNREAMLSLLFRETDRVQRLNGALCVMAMDIDDFGHWNAELGREACDGLLGEVSTRTGRLLRSYDLLGRTGADAFLLALPGCGVANASLLAERLRMEVFGEPFQAVAGSKGAVSVRLTASFGIAASGGRSPVVVLREAERALEQARQAGPDTIRCAGVAYSEERLRFASEAALSV